MLKPSLQDIVFRKTIPNPKQHDPVSFFTHVQRNLVPEVRLEVQTFYGSLDCVEAQYPGLDYTFDPHRRRLARYPWHRRLFRVFNELRLTDGEILSLCQWEGTRSAKERYEAETKRKIRDTTADDVSEAPAGTGPRARMYGHRTLHSYSDAQTPSEVRAGAFEEGIHFDQPEEDDTQDSAAIQLNQQLQSTVESSTTIPLDAQWEQWMKEALERNMFDRDTLMEVLRERYSSVEASSAFANNMSEGTASSLEMTQPQINQRYDDLRTMLQDLQSANNQLSTENAALAMFLSRTQPETAR